MTTEHHTMPPDDQRDPIADPREELLLALGRLVLAFGQLDEALHDALWMALGQRDEIRVLTSGLRFPQLVDRFHAVYSGFRDPVYESLGVDRLCRELMELNDQRNREIHAVWDFWADSSRPVRMQRTLCRGGLAVRMESVEPMELSSLAARMDNAAKKVWEITLDYERQLASAGDQVEAAQSTSVSIVA